MSSESQIQQTIIQKLSGLASKYNFVYFAPMNEGTMMVLKAFKVPKVTCIKIMNWMEKMGFRSGVSDIIIFHNERAYCLELKKPGGKQLDSQILFSKNVRKVGVEYGTAHDWDEVVWCLEKWNIL